MRAYVDKKNVQAKSYYSDRFYKSPQLPKESVESDEIFNKDIESLKSKFEIKESYIQKGQLVLVINPEDNIAVLKHLRDELNYNFLSELSATDWLADEGEFEVFYQMLSTSKRKRARVKCRVKEDQSIESAVCVYKSADWAEREMYDMFGIKANNHPYMKRIIMPDDWSGHPLRKSYPLHGDEAAQWYEVDKIFGKEYRDVIGPENRDQARIDKKDTKNYAKIKHEVPFGEEPSDSPTDMMDYQEKDGVGLFGINLITKFTKENSKELKSRK